MSGGDGGENQHAADAGTCRKLQQGCLLNGKKKESVLKS